MIFLFLYFLGNPNSVLPLLTLALRDTHLLLTIFHLYSSNAQSLEASRRVISNMDSPLNGTGSRKLSCQFPPLAVEEKLSLPRSPMETISSYCNEQAVTSNGNLCVSNELTSY